MRREKRGMPASGDGEGEDLPIEGEREDVSEYPRLLMGKIGMQIGSISECLLWNVIKAMPF